MTVARTVLIFMQIATADRKRVVALRKIWDKKMQEVQAVMVSVGRTNRTNRERVMVRWHDFNMLFLLHCGSRCYSDGAADAR